eukprot:745999-Hanusia_phi.AAC.3
MSRIQKLRQVESNSLKGFPLREVRVRQDAVAINLIQEENHRICEKSTLISEILQRDKLIADLRTRVKQQEEVERELSLLTHARSDLELADRQVEFRVRLQVMGEKKRWIRDQYTKRQVLCCWKSAARNKHKLMSKLQEFRLKRRKGKLRLRSHESSFSSDVLTRRAAAVVVAWMEVKRTRSDMRVLRRKMVMKTTRVSFLLWVDISQGLQVTKRLFVMMQRKSDRSTLRRYFTRLNSNLFECRRRKRIDFYAAKMRQRRDSHKLRTAFRNFKKRAAPARVHSIQLSRRVTTMLAKRLLWSSWKCWRLLRSLRKSFNRVNTLRARNAIYRISAKGGRQTEEICNEKLSENLSVEGFELLEGRGGKEKIDPSLVQAFAASEVRRESGEEDGKRMGCLGCCTSQVVLPACLVLNMSRRPRGGDMSKLVTWMNASGEETSLSSTDLFVHPIFVSTLPHHLLAF